MPESLELFAQVALLRQEVEEHGAILSSILRSQAPHLREEILAAMRKDPTLAAILLAVDGQKTQGEILTLVAAQGHKSANLAGVSRRMERLANDFGLISLAKRRGSAKVYRRTVLDKALRISRTVEKDGLATP